MAEVQWIKLKVGLFDGQSFKRIKHAKIGSVSYRDKLTAVWFELLDLAGKSNHGGLLIDNNELPYKSFEDIACLIDRDEKEVELCINFFINEKMIEIVNDVYCLSNFQKYQYIEGLEKIREQKRLAQAKWRDSKKALLVDTTVDSTDRLPSLKNKELEIELKEDTLTSIEESDEKSSLSTSKSTQKAHEPKKKYGEFNRVLLTSEEYQRLITDFGEELTLRVIKAIDESMESTNNKNKWINHNLVIRRAIREKWNCVYGKSDTFRKNQTNNPFLQIAKDEGIL